jgi:hypothetical protein
MDSIVNARPLMIATLDTFREMLEDTSMLTHPHRLFRDRTIPRGAGGIGPAAISFLDFDPR